MPSTQNFVDNKSDVISFVSPMGTLLSASGPSGDIFGYSPNELLGRDLFELIHMHDRDQLRVAFQIALQKPQAPLRVEMRFCRRDWTWSPVESWISNRLHEPGVGAVVVTYRELGAPVPKKQRKKVSPYNAVEDFAAMAVHDLREPLRTISMFTELLTEGSFEPAQQRLAQQIADGVTRTFTLLDGLSSVAISRSSDVPQPCQLEPIVDDALKNLTSAIHASDAIVTVGRLPEALGVRSNLVRVFQNLIGNAIKYRSDAPIRIHVSTEALGPGWIVRVKDNGIGIDAKYHDCIFQLLKRLHGQEIPGAGIGLAVCKRIVEANGGKIWVESDYGAGSTFCFTLRAAASTGVMPLLAVGHRLASI